MHNYKRLGAVTVAFALSVVGTATASAAEFTASETGTVFGKALESQVFTVNGGQVKCNTAETFGPAVKVSTQQHVTVAYRGCTVFGFSSAHISPVTYLLTASGEVHLLNTITIESTILGCSITVGSQTLAVVGVSNNGGKLNLTPNVTGITYTTTGGICGTSGSNGTFLGASELERIGGGSLTYDPGSFTYSANGSLSGKATEAQVWTTAAGQVKCTTAETSGVITKTATEEQEVEVKYGGCTVLGFAGTHISPAKFSFTANGTIRIRNTITITATMLGCHLRITPQIPGGTVSYVNHGDAIIFTPHLTGIHYDTAPSSGTLCGTTSTTATFTGNSTVEREGGGSIDFHS